MERLKVYQHLSKELVKNIGDKTYYNELFTYLNSIKNKANNQNNVNDFINGYDITVFNSSRLVVLVSDSGIVSQIYKDFLIQDTNSNVSLL